MGRERVTLEKIVHIIDELDTSLADASELLEMAAEEDDEETVQSVTTELDGKEKSLELLEFKRMFSGQMDANNAFLDIQSGSGGTEAHE